MTRSPRLLGTVAAPVLAVVLALTLSSCDTAKTGAAATVGDRRIPVSDVQDGYRDVVAVIGPDQQVRQTQVLGLLIMEPYLLQAAASAGQGVSVEDARVNMLAAAKTAPPKLTDAGIEVWRASMAFGALSQDPAKVTAIGKELKQAKVDINPRWGSRLDYTTLSIVADTPNWLVSKAPAATATPAPGATATP